MAGICMMVRTIEKYLDQVEGGKRRDRRSSESKKRGRETWWLGGNGGPRADGIRRRLEEWRKTKPTAESATPKPAVVLAAPPTEALVGFPRNRGRAYQGG